ncbi:DUF2703 domain-containing protein [Papillibacter cinnamivorans]|uniref:4Fe-4S dicluster domain-containing protein n=1 Tax=Papillibacter cinnamivorans DSM 12816 TaxID=1122930 RepID=A0A1W2BEA4_9FIRM|nr:DUF2703 domain-containing protein [Papillibacter cinnamivorans]SMC71353.1 4Fe-4S dicluster domain-containing protein [Papillibacter cinnamivorans DSM 12816]
MAKSWYPVIDYMTCIECGTCVSKCPHEVYDDLKAPSPVVKFPEECVDHCHGCGNRCPVGAITYVGDDTGWLPPGGGAREPDPCCSGTGAAECEKTVTVEYLYLDLHTCERCIGTDQVLDEVMTVLAPALRLAGFGVDYRKIGMETAGLAAEYRFLSSPTIRVNGRDICPDVRENPCRCCGEISGTDVNCRIFEYNGETYETPPKEMLARAILYAVFEKPENGCSCDTDYALPENLRAFYEGKDGRPSRACEDGCC